MSEGIAGVKRTKANEVEGRGALQTLRLSSGEHWRTSR